MSQETKAQTRHLMINKTPVDIFRATEHVAAVPCIFGNSQLLSRGVGHANVTLPMWFVSVNSQDIGEALISYSARVSRFSDGDTSPTSLPL